MLVRDCVRSCCGSVECIGAFLVFEDLPFEPLLLITVCGERDASDARCRIEVVPPLGCRSGVGRSTRFGGEPFVSLVSPILSLEATRNGGGGVSRSRCERTRPTPIGAGDDSDMPGRYKPEGLRVGVCAEPSCLSLDGPGLLPDAIGVEARRSTLALPTDIEVLVSAETSLLTDATLACETLRECAFR